MIFSENFCLYLSLILYMPTFRDPSWTKEFFLFLIPLKKKKSYDQLLVPNVCLWEKLTRAGLGWEDVLPADFSDVWNLRARMQLFWSQGLHLSFISILFVDQLSGRNTWPYLSSWVLSVTSSYINGQWMNLYLNPKFLKGRLNLHKPDDYPEPIKCVQMAFHYIKWLQRIFCHECRWK